MHPTVVLTIVAVVVAVVCTVLVTSLVWYTRRRKREQDHALPEVPEDDYVEERPESDFVLPRNTEKLTKPLRNWLRAIPANMVVEQRQAQGYTSLVVRPEWCVDDIYKDTNGLIVKEHALTNDVLNQVDFVVQHAASAYQVRIRYDRPVGHKWPRCTPVPAKSGGQPPGGKGQQPTMA